MSIFYFLDSAFSVKSNNSWSSSKCLRYSPFLFSFHIVVLCFIPKCESFRLRVFFCWLFGLSLFFPYDFQITKALLIEKMIFPQLNSFCISAKNQLGIFVWLYFCILNSIPFICVSIPLGKLHNLNYCMYMIVDFISGWVGGFFPL